jgi:hypothetical protein
MLAHQSQRNHDLSPLEAIRPGRRDRLAATAGVAGVIAIAALGIFLAFMGSQSPEPEKAPVNDQESGIFTRSAIPSPTAWATSTSTAGPTTPESGPAPENALPPQNDKTPEITMARPGPVPSPGTVPEPPGGLPHLVPAQTAAAREDSTTAGGSSERSRAPKSTPADTKAGREAGTEAVTPAPRTIAPPEVHEEDRKKEHEPSRSERPDHHPRPAVRLGADPCATFPDFRRDYCYLLLDRLTR